MLQMTWTFGGIALVLIHLHCSVRVYSIALEVHEPADCSLSQFSFMRRALSYLPAFDSFSCVFYSGRHAIPIAANLVITAQPPECDSCSGVCFRDSLMPLTLQRTQSNLPATMRPSALAQSTRQALDSKAASHMTCQVTPAHLKLLSAHS